LPFAYRVCGALDDSMPPELFFPLSLFFLGLPFSSVVFVVPAVQARRPFIGGVVFSFISRVVVDLLFILDVFAARAISVVALCWQFIW
jgi:hypothetical protein